MVSRSVFSDQPTPNRGLRRCRVVSLATTRSISTHLSVFLFVSLLRHARIETKKAVYDAPILL
jgi:hypothetical protein